MPGRAVYASVWKTALLMRAVFQTSIPLTAALSAVFCTSCIYNSADDYPATAMALLSEQETGSECEFVNTTQRPVPFEILQKAGTHAICAVCHSGPSPTNGFDVTDYYSAKARTVPGNPDASLLFQMVRSGGLMNAYTSTRPCIIPAAERWIADGANP